MKIVILGGTGHIGTYLIPRLVRAGHEVISVSRQQRAPYYADPAWRAVQQLVIDRDLAEAQGIFGSAVRDLRADIVVDLICFAPESATRLVEALKDDVQHFLHCGTIWVHGASEQIPTTETQERKPFGDYGIKKAAIESYLLEMAAETGFPVTILHPGHITGPGWLPINPAGNLDAEVFRKLADGREVLLPNIGMETLHHVHADDVAQAFEQAIVCRDASAGESFHVVSAQALTLRGYAEGMAKWFGRKPNLRFLPWEAWKNTVSERDAELTWDHIAHSPVASIEKAKRLLQYSPRYSSLEAAQEAVRHYFGSTT